MLHVEGNRIERPWNFCCHDVVDVPGDGDCMFAAIAHQLNSSCESCPDITKHKTALDVRRQIVEYIRRDADMTARIADSLEPGETIERYFEQMNLSGT